MIYIDKLFYETFTKTTISQDTFDLLAEVSSRLMDDKTMNKTTKFESYSNSIQEAIKKATASQVRTLVKAGGVKAIDKGNIVSESIGSYNYTKASKSEQKVETINGIEISPMVDVYLRPTGLLNRGIG